MSKDYTFQNVTIVINASSAKEAYTQLCEAIDTMREHAEMVTDTYLEEGADEPRDTSELFM